MKKGQKTNKEVWKKIKNFDKYQISYLGNIRRYNKASSYDKRIPEYTYLKPQKIKRGYMQVVLYKNSKPYKRSIHRLVAEAFIPNPENKPQVNHKDENPSNNCVNNLEWCDNWYNTHYGNHIENVRKKHLKTINQYDINSVLIKKWESIINASEKLNIDSSSITKVCKGKRKSAGGYIWKYEGGDVYV